MGGGGRRSGRAFAQQIGECGSKRENRVKGTRYDDRARTRYLAGTAGVSVLPKR